MLSSEILWFDFKFHFNHQLGKWALVFKVDQVEYIYDHYETVEQCQNVQDYLQENDEYIDLDSLRHT